MSKQAKTTFHKPGAMSGKKCDWGSDLCRSLGEVVERRVDGEVVETRSLCDRHARMAASVYGLEPGR